MDKIITFPEYELLALAEEHSPNVHPHFWQAERVINMFTRGYILLVGNMTMNSNVKQIIITSEGRLAKQIYELQSKVEKAVDIIDKLTESPRMAVNGCTYEPNSNGADTIECMWHSCGFAITGWQDTRDQMSVVHAEDCPYAIGRKFVEENTKDE